MMETVGNIFLHVALIVCAYSILVSLVGGKTRRPELVKSARNAVWGMSLLVVGASALLVGCFLADRFNVEYVFQYSNSTMPFFYKVAALWGGQNGSLLFWLMILCVFSSFVMWVNRRRSQELLPYIITTLSAIALFFLIILVVTSNPFDVLPFAAQDGRGLNPLLQNYYMVIHPPSLYLGYVGMSVPFAYAMAALISGRLDNQWIIQVRRWTIVAWFFLSIGNLLGASWAYEVLGWGGYWAWDPVENAAFIPWLTATAFLHSAIIQEKRGMLKTWNMTLVILSFLMTMTGTFLTRSGIISSVHSFAKSEIGPYFLIFLTLCIVISFSLLIYRLKDLRSKNTLDSFVSREATFLFNNLILVGAAFAVLWGTLFPVLSEWVRGVKITVGPPFFNSVMVPIGLVLLLLTGIGPVLAWRKTTPKQLKKNFLWPVVCAMVTTVIASVVMDDDRLSFLTRMYALVSFSLCAFVLATIVLEFHQGIAVRRRTLGEDMITALLRLIMTNRRRYGGYVVHFGIVLCFLGFTGNAFKQEREVELKPGETADVAEYTFRYDRLSSSEDAHQQTVYAHMAVMKNGKPYTAMQPARIFYRAKLAGEAPQPNTLVSIKRSLQEDVYIALLSFDPNANVQSVFLKIVINPLVQFIWIGGLFLIFGTVIGMWPEPRARLSRTMAKAALWMFALLPAAGLMLAYPTSTYAQTSREFDHQVETISKQLRCLCGCNFPDLASCSCDEWAIPAKAEIRARIRRGEDEMTVLKYFIGREGEEVLAAPLPEGFNRAVWIVPGVAILMAVFGISFVVRKWHRETHHESESVKEVASASPSDHEKYRKQLDRELYGDE